MKPKKRETLFNTESYYHSYPTGYAHYRTSFFIQKYRMPHMRYHGSLGGEKNEKEALKIKGLAGKPANPFLLPWKTNFRMCFRLHNY